jgi:hypothetical protein
MAGGWGVEVPGEDGRRQQQQQQRPPAKNPPKQQRAAAGGAAQAAGPAAGGKNKQRAKRGATPFVQLQSPEAKFGLAMLSESLAAAAAAGAPPAAGQQPAPSIQDAKDSLTAAGPAGKRRAPQTQAQAPARPRAEAAPQPGFDGVDEDDFDGDLESKPAFQLTFSDKGMVR